MAQAKLPVAVRTGVRDHFDSEKCAVQKAFCKLHDVIGLKIECDVEWDILWNSLAANFEDKSTFVPNVAGVVEAWCDVLTARLDDDKYIKWTEEVLEKLESSSALRIVVQASTTDRPTTTWSTQSASFVITLPTKKSFSPPRASSSFEVDFENIFIPPSSTSTVINTAFSSDTNADGWAEINDAGDTVSTSQTISSSTIMTPQSSNFITPMPPTKMPSVVTFPNPDLLLPTLTPYILHVKQKVTSRLIGSGSSRGIDQGSFRTVGQTSSTTIDQGPSTIVVQGTHEPTLQFLHQYLSRWVKKDHMDTRKVPLLRLTLCESNIGFTHDTLVIEPYDPHQQSRGVEMNITVVLAIVENILGYRRLPVVTAGFWEYTRDVAFQ